MNLRIRPMQITDCAQVLELSRCFSAEALEKLEERFRKERHRAGQMVFVSVDETSQVWGWIQVMEITPLTGEPRGLIVKLKERDNPYEVGRSLIKIAETWSMERGHRSISVLGKVKKLQVLEASSESQQEAPEPASGQWPQEVVIYSDGASRGNPGAAAVGVHITTLEGDTLGELSEALGIETNNVAEYTALLRGLELALSHGVQNVVVRADSELMIRQMRGEYKVKSEGLRPLFEKCRQLASSFASVTYEHVRREYNKKADALANQALDQL